MGFFSKSCFAFLAIHVALVAGACKSYENQCKVNTNECYVKSFMCDGYLDCGPGDDTEENVALCGPNGSNAPNLWPASCVGYRSYTCDSGQCIPAKNECDGIFDCGDKSDETKQKCAVMSNKWITRSCSGKTYNTFPCTNGMCIDRAKACDGFPNCGDSSDETRTGCTTVKKPYKYGDF